MSFLLRTRPKLLPDILVTLSAITCSCMLHTRVKSLAAKLSMIVPVKRDGDLEEWAIVELQGDLKFDTQNVTNKFIGDLHFSKTGTPIFIIGIHVLHGKEMNLPKPFAVLIKEKREEDVIADTSEIQAEYTVKAIIKRKLVFRSRPKPIIMNVPKSN